MSQLRTALAMALALGAIAAPAQAATARASIVAGSPAAIASAPYQVRVLVRSGNKIYQCGGSIHDETHVITAAHCVFINGALAAPASVTVGYGAASIAALSGAAVSEVTMPTAYASDDSYDIAVLDLSAPLSGFGGSSVRAIPLASAGSLATGVDAESNTFATGWGATREGGSTTSSLMGVQLPLRSDLICSAAYSGYVAARTVCAGGRGVAASDNPDTCQGDSGGPLALGGQLAGITSYGDGCGRPVTPGAYTEVSDPAIGAIAAGRAPSSSLSKGSGQTTASPPAPAPSPTIPVAQTIPAPTPIARAADTVRPVAKLGSLRCHKHRCVVTLRASDDRGSVKKLSARVSRRVRRCHGRGFSRRCASSTRTVTLKTKRTSAGYTATIRLAPSLYRLTAVATDPAGNRSKALSKRFRVRP